MPTPTSSRPRSRVVTSGAKAATREPAMKMSPVKKMTLRRPNRSERPPAKAAPTAAPAERDARDQALHAGGEGELRPDEEQRAGDHAGVVAEEQPAQRRDADDQIEAHSPSLAGAARRL